MNKNSTVCLHRVVELLTDVSSFGILLLNNRYNQSILVPRYDFLVLSFEIWFHFRFVTWLGQNIRMNLFRPTVILKIKFLFGGIHLLLRLVYFLKHIYVFNLFFPGCQTNWSYISCFIPRHISRRWMHCNRCWRRNTQVD